MKKWLFQYQDLIESIDGFAIKYGDEDFLFAWEYTKKMVVAHGLAIKPDDVATEEAISIAWSQFEDTFDDEAEQAIVSLAGIIANLVTAVPVGKNEEFHMALEVGFARARGFTEEDAIIQHEKWLQEHGPLFSEEESEEEPPQRFEPNELRSMFRIVDGGQPEDEEG